MINYHSGLEQEEGLLDLSKDSTLFPLYFRPHITVLMEIKYVTYHVTYSATFIGFRVSRDLSRNFYWLSCFI